MLQENLNRKIRELYKRLDETGNGEDFYSEFYGSVVLNSTTYFHGLREPLSALLATTLLTKFFSILMKMKAQNPLKS